MINEKKLNTNADAKDSSTKDSMLSRAEMLLGKKKIEALARTRVAIFGVGGVGGYALEALLRSGISKIDVIDSDNVSISNLNRQIIATASTVGMKKVEAAINRCKDINPDAEITPIYEFYSAENADGFDLTKYDYVIDAIDTVGAKCELIERATKSGVRIISSMGTGGKLSPAMLEVSDIYKTSVCPLARAVRTELKRRGVKKLKVVYSKEDPIKVTVTDTHGARTVHRAPGSMIFVPAAAGLILASEVIKDIVAEVGGEDE